MFHSDKDPLNCSPGECHPCADIAIIVDKSKSVGVKNSVMKTIFDSICGETQCFSQWRSHRSADFPREGSSRIPTDRILGQGKHGEGNQANAY